MAEENEHTTTQDEAVDPASALLGDAFARGSRMLIEMAFYLKNAGWKREGKWWEDPHPELRGVGSNEQYIYRAVQMQIARDIGDPEVA